MRRIGTLALVAGLGLGLLGPMVGCTSSAGGMMGGDDDTGDDDDDTPPPPPPAWVITVDMSALDRFVQGGAPMWAVGGKATASLGLAGVDVAGAPVSADQQGGFATQVAVAPGITVVPILATDSAGNTRQAHRSLISAAYLAEGHPARDAAGVVLNDAVLQAMAGSLAGAASDVNVAAEVMMRSTLSSDSQCTTWPVYAEQDPTEVHLQLDGGELWLQVLVPNLYVYFEGECNGLFSTIPIAGEMGMSIEAWTALTPKSSDACLVGFNHSTPEVGLPGWYFSVWGTGGPLQSWIVDLFSGSKSQEAHDQFQSEFQGQADTLLTEKLADIVVFDREENMTLLERPVAVHLCLTALEQVGGQLIARIGATATGGGDKGAPGAPQLGGARATPAPNELLLDADLVGQLLFSSWRAGGLHKEAVQQVDFGLLSLIARGLTDRYPTATTVDVSIDGELPALVRVSMVEGADLHIEIGDLMVDLVIQGERAFRFGARIQLDVDLQPMDGALIPTVVKTVSEVHLLEEVVDGPDEALEAAVNLKLGGSAEALLGGARLALPQIPGLGVPGDVTPDPAGRFLHVSLH